MKIFEDIKLICLYAIQENLIYDEDFDYVINRLTNVLGLEYYIDHKVNYKDVNEPSTLLDPLLDFAFSEHLFSPDTIVQRDLFESKIMDIFVPKPTTINYIFDKLLSNNPKDATDYFYRLSERSNYIKVARTSKNLRWKSKTPYGIFDMTINLSKPEKDPRDIIKLANTTSTSYPKCVLCKEQVGFYGNHFKPGRSNHRIVHMMLNGEEFYLQYSPYVYYNEHSIVLKKEHEPMNVTVKTFNRLFDFVDLLPHYFIGSNAGLPIVGGSILGHEHYQGGRYSFPIEDAKILSEYIVDNVKIMQLYWPLSVIRLESNNRESVVNTADKIFKFWEKYNDIEAGIYSFTDKPHNAITPIARKKGELYILDITLRNNLTTEKYPLGVFHPHSENHHIKKENIGLIEVMGLAVLPARLKEELEAVKQAIVTDSKLPEKYKVHGNWTTYLKQIYNNEDIDNFLNDQVALKFVKCIEDSGVFKQTSRGANQFDRFTSELIINLRD